MKESDTFQKQPTPDLGRIETEVPRGEKQAITRKRRKETRSGGWVSETLELVLPMSTSENRKSNMYKYACMKSLSTTLDRDSIIPAGPPKVLWADVNCTLRVRVPSKVSLMGLKRFDRGA